MKWFNNAILILVAMLAACTATFGGNVATNTFNDKAAIALESVTTARKEATTLLQSGKITVEQDKKTQAALDLVRTSIQSAQAINASDPTTATALLTQALGTLAAIEPGAAK